MFNLVVRLHGQKIQTLELSDPATLYWAGRNENCQIVLKADSGISRQHFKIFCKEDLWYLEVVSRFNEIHLGDKTVREFELKEGLSFGLPPYDFAVQSRKSSGKSGGALVPVEVGGDRESGIASDDQVGDRTMTKILTQQSQNLLVYRDPESREEILHILTSDSYSVGRDSACGIILNDARVSRKQFSIENRNGQFFLLDGKGVNGTYLNKKKIETKDPVLIQSGDRIDVLNHKFTFEVRDPDFNEKLEKVQHIALMEPVVPAQMALAISSEPNGLPVEIAQGQVGSLQPYQPQAIGGEFNFTQHSEEPPVQPTEFGSVEKELNFWGFKIILNKQNKFRLMIAGIALLVLVIVVGSNQDDNLDDSKLVAQHPADPFSKLSKPEQDLVKNSYQLAKDLYGNGKFELAQTELQKVFEKIPAYLDADKLKAEIEIGLKSQEEQAAIIAARQVAMEQEERIQNKVAFCRQQIQPTWGVSDLDNCLEEVKGLNPEHPLILKINEDVARQEEDRKRREAEEALRTAQIAELHKLYNDAHALGEKDPLKGIAAFKDILTRSMPDPDKLLEKAKGEIKRLERRIKNKVNEAIEAVRGQVESGKHKEAIIALEKALALSPEDESLREEIDRITEELRRKMQSLYQEAILEENLGNIDTAKDRWRSILSQDIPNGEYFAKAKIKLKKYGGL